MNDLDLDELAGEYVLGTLEPEQRREVEIRLASDDELRECVGRWHTRLAPLASSGPSAEPSASLWQKVVVSIDEPALPGTTTVRMDEGEWQELAPGCELKTLFVDEREGMRSVLLRMAPGASLPAHDHSQSEECMVLQGEMIIGEVRFRVGDYHIAHAGTLHPEIRSKIGALVYVRSELADPISHR